MALDTGNQGHASPLHFRAPRSLCKEHFLLSQPFFDQGSGLGRGCQGHPILLSRDSLQRKSSSIMFRISWIRSLSLEVSWRRADAFILRRAIAGDCFLARSYGASPGREGGSPGPSLFTLFLAFTITSLFIIPSGFLGPLKGPCFMN